MKAKLYNLASIYVTVFGVVTCVTIWLEPHSLTMKVIGRG